MTAFLISASELREKLGSPDLVLLDVRANLKDPLAGRVAFAAGHIPGARQADMREDVSGPCTGSNGRNPFPTMERFCERMRALGVNQTSEVVVYDDGPCNFACRLWFTFRYAGFANVRVLDGGLKAWQAAGGEMSDELPAYEAGNMVASEPLERVFTIEEVLANQDDPQYALIDARGHGRYLGQNETLDRIGGHIPGAMSRPSSENLADGVFKSPEVLKQEFEAVFARRPGMPIVNTCGSGVTACCNHLSMKMAGFEPLGVYIGSFSEWVSDPARPVSTAEE
ncbi:MAG: sulfurtransferase [Burkholderiaceae bacterium]|nr:sulfurtransferase [Burkholderiaceae bacterium]